MYMQPGSHVAEEEETPSRDFLWPLHQTIVGYPRRIACAT